MNVDIDLILKVLLDLMDISNKYDHDGEMGLKREISSVIGELIRSMPEETAKKILGLLNVDGMK